MFDYTAIADRLRTVSWRTDVVNRFTGPTLPVKSKGHERNPPKRKQTNKKGPNIHQRGNDNSTNRSIHQSVKYKRTDALPTIEHHSRMDIHGGHSCKPEVRPGTLEESASPAWLAAPVTSPKMTEKPTGRKFENQWTTMTTLATKNYDYNTIADRLRTPVDSSPNSNKNKRKTL